MAEARNHGPEPFGHAQAPYLGKLELDIATALLIVGAGERVAGLGVPLDEADAAEAEIEPGRPPRIPLRPFLRPLHQPFVDSGAENRLIGPEGLRRAELPPA